MAKIILRKFSACFSSDVLNVICESLVTPSTSSAMSFPNSFSICSKVACVSSTVSCRSPVAMLGRSSRKISERLRDARRMDHVRFAT